MDKIGVEIIFLSISCDL